MLVEAVADLVEDAEEAVGEVLGVESGRDPAVAGADPGAERVRCGVEPPSLEVEANRAGDGLAEDSLAVDRVVALGQGPDPLGRRAGDLLDQGNQVVAERPEERDQGPGGGPRLVLVEQGVVGVGPRSRKAGGFLLLEPDDRFEPGEEAGEVARGPRGDPLPLRHRRGPGQLLDERPRELGGSVEIATPFAEVCPLHRPEVARSWPRRVLDRGEEVAERGVGGPLVGQPGEQGHLIAPIDRPPSGQIGLLVPGEDARTGRQERPLAGAADELVVCGSQVQGQTLPGPEAGGADPPDPSGQNVAMPRTQAAILAQTYQTRKLPLPATISCSVSLAT